MCGITGFINFNGEVADLELLRSMTNAIAHRGPDAEGQWIDRNVAIGHRRLSIIDLSQAAAQPMISENYRYVLSYNGALYNFRELRSELEKEGFWFRSNSDTEVVLNALIAWGEEAISRFNGMFAFAFWDRKQQTLLLARDRYGIKPLYYYQDASRFVFGSEQKAILQNSDIPRVLNKPALLEYFTFQNFFTDQTLISGIQLLPPGHFARIDILSGSKQLQSTCYWDFEFREPEEAASEPEYCEELVRLFAQAVNRQLVSDVEIGSYLSGGMDSGSITAVASQSLANLKTFTCGFDLSSASGIELAYDERAKAEAMSAHFMTEHYEMVLKAGDMERAFPALMYHLEEPRVGQSYPNYYAAQLASKFVKVVISGAGGDELFAGYPWRYYRAAVCNDFEHYVDQYFEFWQRLVSKDELQQLFAPIWQDVKHVDTREIFKNVFLTHQNQLEKPEDYINHSLYFEAKTHLHGLLVMEDKLSMAHGLETRLPFLDNDLVDFAMRCPVRCKLMNLQNVIRVNENEPGSKSGKYFERTNDGKRILRDAMKEYVPDDILNAVKQGFSAPDGSWFKGQSIDYVQHNLLQPDTAIIKVFESESVHSLVKSHVEGIENRRLPIWSLLCLEENFKQVRYLTEFSGDITID